MQLELSCKSCQGQSLLPSIVLAQLFTMRRTGRALRGLKLLLPRMRQIRGEKCTEQLFRQLRRLFWFLSNCGKRSCLRAELSGQIQQASLLEDRPPPLCSSAQGNLAAGGKPSLRKGGWQTSPPLSAEYEGTSCPPESSHGKVAWG